MVTVNRERLNRLVKVAGGVLALELFMPGGTLIAVCLLCGSRRRQAPAWARKWLPVVGGS